MARASKKDVPADPPLPFGATQSTRLMLVLLGAALLVGALVAPWWTRGMNVDEEQLSENDGDMWFVGFWPGSEGIYYNYGAFQTPSNGNGGTSTDAAREPATALLGVGLVLCAAFVVAGVTVRWLMARGTLETSHDAPVRLAICAFVAGLFAVLWGAFFLPMSGDNPGMLYGEEPFDDDFETDVLETTRYANVGFFLGIAGAVLFPAYLWFDAARVRALHTYGWTASAGDATDAPVA